MRLARQMDTDVEGVVSWLAGAYEPQEALRLLLA